MELALKLASIFFTMILVDNYVLAKFLGICPFLGVSKKLDSAVGMSLAVTFVMVLATAATWPIQMFLLTPPGSEGTARDLGYLQTIVFILIIAILVQLLENFLKKFIPALYKSLGVYLPLITTNCTILGVTILNLDNGYSFPESMRRRRRYRLPGGHGAVLRRAPQGGAGHRARVLQGPAHYPGGRRYDVSVLHGLRRHCGSHLRCVIGRGS